MLRRHVERRTRAREANGTAIGLRAIEDGSAVEAALHVGQVLVCELVGSILHLTRDGEPIDPSTRLARLRRRRRAAAVVLVSTTSERRRRETHMRMPGRLHVAMLVLAGSAGSGCGGGAEGAVGAASYAGVTLRVNDSYEVNPFHGSTASGRWAVVNLTLENHSDQPVAPVASSFIVQSDSGLQHPGDVMASANAPDACPTATLGTGGSVTCTFVADVPYGEEPDSLVFLATSHHGEKWLRVDLDPKPCTHCGDRCVDVATDPDNCGGCGVEAPQGGLCDAGTPVCLDEGDAVCDGACTKLAKDPDNCGRCGVAVGVGMHCKQGKVVCDAATPDLCGDVCVDTRTDPDNCGDCGVGTPVNASCVGGAPQCDPGATRCGGQCRILASDRSNCGECGHRCGAAFTCGGGRCTTPLSSLWDRRSCDDLCADEALECVHEEARYENAYLTGSEMRTYACDEDPPDEILVTRGHDAFYFHLAEVDCTCAEP